MCIDLNFGAVLSSRLRCPTLVFCRKDTKLEQPIAFRRSEFSIRSLFRRNVSKGSFLFCFFFLNFGLLYLSRPLSGFVAAEYRLATNLKLHICE